MNTFEWESGTVVERPYVLINGQKYYVQDGTISGGTPVSSTNLNETQNIINQNIVDSLNDRINVLWQNSNPISEFPAQTVNLNSNDYNYYEIICVTGTAGDDALRTVSSGKIPKGYGTRLSYSFAGSGGVNARSRITNFDNNLIEFKNGYAATGATAYTENNNTLIPILILGYKTEIV